MTNDDGNSSNYVSNRDLARKMDSIDDKISGMAVSIGRFEEWRLSVDRRLVGLENALACIEKRKDGNGSSLKDTVNLVLGWVFRFGVLLAFIWGLVRVDDIVNLLP